MAMPPFGLGKVRAIPWHGSSGIMQAESPSALRFLVDAQAGALNVHLETIPRGSRSDTAQIQNTQSSEPNPT